MRNAYPIDLDVQLFEPERRLRRRWFVRLWALLCGAALVGGLALGCTRVRTNEFGQGTTPPDQAAESALVDTVSGALSPGQPAPVSPPSGVPRPQS